MDRYPEWRSIPHVRVQCRDCTAECCKHVSIQIDEPTTRDDFQAIADYVHYTGVSVYEDHEGDWLVEFKTRCCQLDGNRCRAFKRDKQPMTCREYTVGSCVMNAPGEYWRVMFDTPDDVARHARQLGLTIRRERRRDCPRGCCNHLSVPIDEPESWRDFDDIRWYVAHRSVSVHKDHEGDWLVTFHTRPMTACAKCDADACSSDDQDYPVVFSTMDDVDSYLLGHDIRREIRLELSSLQ